MTTTTTRSTSGGGDNESLVNKDPRRPPTWKVWVLASRPHTLTASVSPVLVGHHATVALLGLEETSCTTTMAWLAFCVCIQLGTNLHNDHADFVKGADTHQRVGQARATQRGWLTPQQTLSGSYVCLAVALAIGISLNPQNDPIMWFIISTSIFNAFAYTGGQHPLGYIGMERISIAYSGMADLFCFVYFGLVATLTIPYLSMWSHHHHHHHGTTPSRTTMMMTMDTWTSLLPCVWLACCVGFLATAILVVNNTRDRHVDVLAHKRTLAVRFGGTFCRIEYVVLILSSYAMIIVLFLHDAKKSSSSSSSPFHLLPLLSLPFAIPQINAMRFKDGSDLNPHVGGTARLQLIFSALLSLGLRLGATK
jgi:1,4-dihydroxy-2-naphthoate octaprenyltransferase